MMQSLKRMVSVRVLIAITAALPVAVVASGMSIAQVARGLQPAWVDSIAPIRSDRVAESFDRDIAENKRQVLPSKPCWPCRARDALRSDPLGAKSLRLLGTYETDRRGLNAAAPLFNLSVRISRRDAVTHLWLSDFFRKRGNTAAEFRNFDQLLSVQPGAADAVFSLMARDLALPQAQASMREYIHRQRPWTPDFLEAAVAAPEAIVPMHDVFMGMSGQGDTALFVAPYEKALVNQLAGVGEFTRARSLARKMLGSANAAVDTPGFSDRTFAGSISPLGWTNGESEGVATTLFTNGTARVEALSGASGTGMYRIFLLPAGRYRMSVTASAADQAAPLSGQWSVHCMASSGKAINPPLATADLDGIARGVTFSVGPACAAVRVINVVRNVSDAEIAGLDFSQFALQPVDR